MSYYSNTVRENREQPITMPDRVTVTMGRSDAEMSALGYLVSANVDGTEVAGSVLSGFSTFLERQPRHQKEITNVRWLKGTHHEYNPDYHRYRYIMGEMEWQEVVQRKDLWYKFSVPFSSKFATDDIKFLIDKNRK